MAKRVGNGVTYIPGAAVQDEIEDQEDRMLKDSASRRSPMRLFAEDCYLLVKNLRDFPSLFFPLRRTNPLPGVPQTSGSYGPIMVGVLSVFQLPLLAVAFPTAVILPGWITGGLAAVSTTIMWLMARTTWGPLTVDSQVESAKDKFPDEYWVFLNGIATSHPQLQHTVNNLAATFGRPVTGVHNQSWGIPGDLIECLIQRSFFYETQDVRVATAALQKALEDDGISKVVVLAHSQGGLIASLVLDRLYVSMPAEVFRKLEVYTFGSAASYFHNPLTHAPHSESISPVKRRTLVKAASDSLALDKMTDLANAQLKIPNRLIPVIEHYVNGWDLIPRWGVLYHVLLKTGSDYSGRVFVHERQSGHLFDEHYLSVMFPLGAVDADATAAAGAGPGKRVVLDTDPGLFLNHRITLQEKVKGGRRWWGIWRASTWGRRLDDASVPPALSQESSGVTEKSVALSDASADGPGASTGATVKDLSKLWRYLDGGVA